MPSPAFSRRPGMGGGRAQGGAGNVYREASISQGLLLSEFRIKGLRREEVQRKWGVGHLVKRAVRAPQAWVLTLFPASAGRKPGHHLSDQRERLDQPEKGGPDRPLHPPHPPRPPRTLFLQASFLEGIPLSQGEGEMKAQNLFSPGPGEGSAPGIKAQHV